MSKNNKIPSKELLEAIDRYFDCALSDNEERELCRMLATTDSDNPSVLEAKALMGFTTINRINNHATKKEFSSPRFLMRPHSKRKLLKITGVAAAVTLIVSLGMILINKAGSHHINNSECIAYVNGQCITDEETVMSLLVENISELDRGAEEAQNLFIEDLNELLPLTSEME
ncbi:MAG: hypothetical protein K2J87_05470 [Muribaculaceae bacterium]|nr:hypothetical protein [Muribaculaceae bacterium]